MASGKQERDADATEKERENRTGFTWDSAKVVQRHGREDPVPGGAAGRQALLQPRDQRRERGEGRVRGAVLVQRAAQPPGRRQARAHQAGVGGAAEALGQRLQERSPDPDAAAEERRGHVPQPRFVFGRFLVLSTAKRTSDTVHRIINGVLCVKGGQVCSTCMTASELAAVAREWSMKPACFSIQSSARRSPEKAKFPPNSSRALRVLGTALSSDRQHLKECVMVLAASSLYALFLFGSTCNAFRLQISAD